jgi:hypothetical protein
MSASADLRLDARHVVRLRVSASSLTVSGLHTGSMTSATSDDAPRWPIPVVWLAWMADAACRGIDPDLFFPEKGESAFRAKAVCGRCRVRQACLAYALANNERFGVWGGLSERQRRRLRRAGVSLSAPPVRRRPGPAPFVDDATLIDVLTGADPNRPAAVQVRERFGVSQAAAYNYLRRARVLGLVERRGRTFYPALDG